MNRARGSNGSKSLLRRGARPVLHIATLAAFAFVQPLLAVLGGNPAFFIAHDFTALDIILFLALVSIAIPAGLGGLAVVLTGFPQRLSKPLQGGLLALLLFLIAIPGFKKLGVGGTRSILILSALAAVCLALTYLKSSHFQSFVSFLAPALVVFPAFFVVSSPSGQLLTGHFSETNSEVSWTNPNDVPVVLLVFDELPLPSLLDSEGKIDERRFPNFAALAAQSRWFPNASSVSENTQHSLPSILTGQYPGIGLLPSYLDHPQSLFTLFPDRIASIVGESMTALCPPGRATLVGKSDRYRTWRIFVEDTAVTLLHILSPPEWAQKLPPVDRHWGGFLEARAFRDAGRDTDQVLTELEREKDPGLIFLHLQTPHRPWIHLPSGKRYKKKNLHYLPMKGGVWLEDRAAVTASFQQYLFELGYADRILGRFVAGLKQHGVFDRAWLAVLSDHGMAFRPGFNGRRAEEGQFRDILNVVCMVKEPFQRNGVKDGRIVELIDLLPMLAEFLGETIPWRVDGRPLSAPHRTRRRFHPNDNRIPVFLGRDFEMINRTVICREGRQLPLRPGLSGWLEQPLREEQSIRFSGWAADVAVGKPAQQLLITLNGKEIPIDIIRTSRPGVAQAYSKDSLLDSGFTFLVPHDKLGVDDELRVFALAEDYASEVLYNDDYPYLSDDLLASGLASSGCEPSESAYLLTVRSKRPGAEKDGVRDENSVTSNRWKAGPDGRFPLVEDVGRLVGSPAPSEPFRKDPVEVKLEDSSALENVRLDNMFFPAMVSGKVKGDDLPSAIAVAVNGRIETLAAVYGRQEEWASFCGFLPVPALHSGTNRLRLFSVSEDGRIVGELPF